MQLTRHFALEEFTRSDKAKELGVLNSPEPKERIALGQLAYALECIRSGCWNNERAIHITSGFRDARVNAAVGGTKTSHHRKGYAADFYVEGISIERAAKEVESFLIDTDLPFDQLIFEPSRGIIHLSVYPGKGYRRQYLTQRGGAGTKIEEGIIT